MHYKLMIVKVEDNPDKDKPLTYSNNYGLSMPSATMETRTLECLITEHELGCIKQTLLTVWK
jgi:hypothetical protein